MNATETATILVVDDEEPLLNLLTAHLERNHFNVVLARSGAEALKVAFETHPDLVILDVMMPGLDGLTVCRRLREMSDLPIIMLTALSQEEDVVEGLTSGADDYITKPFGIDELLARIRTLLRRPGVKAPTQLSTLSVGDLLIDLPRRKVVVRGERVNLTPTEYDLLVYLARHPNQVLDHRRLLTEVWGFEYVDQLDYLRLYVRYLRRKIEEDPSDPQMLMTERGIGYFLQE